MKQPAVSKIRPLELSQPKAGSPTIVKAPESPAKSIHLEMDQDCQSEDPSMRTTDFFDSTSDIMQSEQAVPGGISLKRHSVGSSVQGLYNGNQGHSPHLKHTGEYSSESSKLKQYMELNYGLDSSSVSQIAPTPHSLDERATEIPVPEIRPLSINFSGAGRASSNTTSKAAQNIDEQYMTSRSNEDNQILGAHVITLQALMRDKDSLASSSARLSKPLQDPLDFKELRQSFLTKPPKRVKMVPPPVTLTTPTSHSPIEIQRTPYPFMYRKHFPPMSPVSENSDDTISQESVLSVYLRRNNANRPVKVSRMVLPMSASLKSPNLNNAKDNEKHFRTLDFDDSLFFRQLRTEYRKLRGPLRFLSAQTLQRITVEYFGRRSDRPVRCGGCDHAESEAMRSPRLLAFKGLADTFSEEKLMEHYRNPRAGKARYSWVHWAHRLAASTAPPFSSPLPYTRDPGTAGQDGEGALPTGSTMTTEKTIDTETTGTRGIGHQRQEEEQEEENRVAAAYDPQAGENGGGGVGIEFIEDWSVARIVAALAFILLLAVAAALLWIFLGISPAGLSSGFRGAGVRVETGLVFGVFVSLLGLAGVLAWMGVSWLVT